MAVIRKRKGSYQVIIRKVGHQPLTKSFKLHSEAQRFAKAVEGKFVEDDYLLNLSAKNKYPNFRTCLERYGSKTHQIYFERGFCGAPD